MTTLEESFLCMHQALVDLGWIHDKEAQYGDKVIYQRLRAGKLERAELKLEGSVFGLWPLAEKKART